MLSEHTINSFGQITKSTINLVEYENVKRVVSEDWNRCSDIKLRGSQTR